LLELDGSPLKSGHDYTFPDPANPVVIPLHRLMYCIRSSFRRTRATGCKADDNRPMSLTAALEPLAPPAWFLRSPLLDRIALTAAALACAVDLVMIVIGGPTLTGAAALILLISGIAASKALGLPGLVLTMAGAVMAILSSSAYAIGWVVVVSTVFSLTLRGMKAFPAAVAAAGALYVATVIADGRGFVDPPAFVMVSTTVAAAATGYAIRVHEEYLDSIRQRARDALSSRELDVNRRITEERLRIAQDLHDVVGHEIAVLNMNLGVIDVHLDPAVGAPRNALESAQDGVRRVLLEMQKILGVLRRGESPSLTMTPVPRLEVIPQLTDALRAAGADASLTMEAGEQMTDPAVSAAAYRVVQEALTNAHRHGTGPIQVRVLNAQGILTVEVENDREPESQRSDVSTGFGVVGMRERVEAAGGNFELMADNRHVLVKASMRIDGSVL
jgi:signal transduction histidine kinase